MEIKFLIIVTSWQLYYIELSVNRSVAMKLNIEKFDINVWLKMNISIILITYNITVFWWVDSFHRVVKIFVLLCISFSSFVRKIRLPIHSFEKQSPGHPFVEHRNKDVPQTQLLTKWLSVMVGIQRSRFLIAIPLICQLRKYH